VKVPAAGLESFFAAASAGQPDSASNSNETLQLQSAVGIAPSAETTRLLRAFNSIQNRDLRRILVEFVETAAGIGHGSARHGTTDDAASVRPATLVKQLRG
jgi:hypothetical protein